jgi:hypothetical protein
VAVCPLPAGGATDLDRADVKARPHPAVSATYATLLATVVMAIIGVLGLWAGEGWLFPSLGPTIVIQAVTPNLPAARLWNTLAGHAIGVAAGFGALFLFRAHPCLPMQLRSCVVRTLSLSIPIGLPRC